MSASTSGSTWGSMWDIGSSICPGHSLARVAETAAASLNVGGDEPLIDPRAITAVANLLRQGAQMATAARPLRPEEAGEPSVVKVVLDHRGRALYFSRSPIPFPRNAGEVVPLAHL